MQIDKEKLLYFGTRETKYYDLAALKLLELGFSEKQIVREDARKFAQNGDYIAIPWLPDTPTELIIGRVKKEQTVDPTRAGDREINLVQYDELLRINF